MNATITPALLHELLSYDPTTGILTWKPRVAGQFKNDRRWSSWNSRFAGKEAGTLNAISGYRVVSVHKHLLYAHRIAYAMVHGEWPEITDHINGQRDDNRIANLRSVSDATNKKNLRRPTTNKSGIVGVRWEERHKKWRAEIRVNDRAVNLGRFATKDEAIAARDAAAAANQFHQNHGRSAAA